MASGIGISPAIMINRMAYEAGVPQGGHLLEVARLRAELAQAQAAEKADPLRPEKPVHAPVNGAEVDLLI